MQVQQVLDQARIPLNDAAKLRYSDAELLIHFNAGLRQLRLKRPDLFYGRLQQPMEAVSEDAAFPLPSELANALADYVVARAETVDDEHINSGRAQMFLQLATEGAG